MKLFSVLALCILSFPYFVEAETVIRDGSSITVSAEEVIEGDYYVSVGPVDTTTMSGSVFGDMYAIGGVVTINGPVHADVSIFGVSAQLHASVTDDVRIVAGETVVADHVGGDLVVLGGVLKVLSTATVEGNIFFYGGEAFIDGTVGGSVLGTAQRIVVSGSVAGDVDVKTTAALSLENEAEIAGSVNSTSAYSVVRAPGAVVEGEVNETSAVGLDEGYDVRSVLIPMLIALFATLTTYLLFRKELVALVQIIETAFVRSALIGGAVLLLAPLVSVLLMLTVLGLYVGLLGVAVTVLLYVGGIVVLNVVVGALLSKQFTKQSKVSLPWILLGAATVQLISFVPIVGPLCLVLLMAVTVGGLARGIYQLLQQ